MIPDRDNLVLIPGVRTIEVNGMSGSKVRPERSLRILQNAARDHDLIFGCEFATLVGMKDALGPEWQVEIHYRSAAKAGSLLAVRRSVGSLDRIRWRLVCPTRLGLRKADRMRSRYAIVGRLTLVKAPMWFHKKLAACHAPPKRNWFLGVLFWPAVKLINAGVTGADWNRLRGYLVKAWNRKWRQIDLLGFAVKRAIHASSAVGVEVHGDHEAVSTVLFNQWVKVPRRYRNG